MRVDVELMEAGGVVTLFALVEFMTEGRQERWWTGDRNPSPSAAVCSGMTPKTREVVYQLFGGGVALAIAFAGAWVGRALFGPAGNFGLVLSVPTGVITGMLLIKLVQFAERVVVDGK